MLRLTVRWLLPAAMAVVMAAASMLQVYVFEVNDYDFGNYLNLVWNVGHGYGWNTSLYQDLFGFTFLGDHLVLLPALIWPILRIWESPYCMAAFHGLVAAAPFLLLPPVARAIYRDAGREEDALWPALFAQLLLLACKPYMAAWSYQTHMGTLAAPAVLLGIWALHAGAWKTLAAACALLLLGQERSSLAVGGLGIYAALLLGRYRLGAALLALSAAWFLAAVKVVIPWFRGPGQEYLYASAVRPFQDPRRKLLYLWRLLDYAAFLPLGGPAAVRAALAAGPLLALSLVSGRKSMYGLGHHYSDMTSLFLLAAALHGICWLTGRPWLARLQAHRRSVLAGVAALALVFLGVRSASVMPPVKLARYLQPKRLARAAALHADLAPFVAAGDDIAVFTQLGLGPYFSLRPLRRVITPERAALPHPEKTLVVTSPACDLWNTDHAGIIAALEGNPTLETVLHTERARVFASRDVASTMQPAGR